MKAPEAWPNHAWPNHAKDLHTCIIQAMSVNGHLLLLPHALMCGIILGHIKQNCSNQDIITI